MLLFRAYIIIKRKLERKHMKKAITGIMLAMMAMTLVSFVPNVTSADVHEQGTWVRMNGNIVNWTVNENTTRTFGWIVANAAKVNKSGTIHEWAIVHAIWSNLTRPHPLGGEEVKINDTKYGNFSYTFSFYTARLIKLSDLIFNKTVTGHDFYLTGYWNASEITETINITLAEHMRQITIKWTEKPLAINATGTLVADWGVVPGPGGMPIGVGKFKLTIDGVGTLSGYAWKGIIWYKELNICDLGDANGDPRGKVDIHDLVKVAKHYGEVPGFSGYDASLDVNGDGRIDIGDLTTIASNIQG
jgi:hypothetical protein